MDIECTVQETKLYGVPPVFSPGFFEGVVGGGWGRH